MNEAELEKRRSMVTKSSIKRKPLSDLANIIRKPNRTSSLFHSKKPGSSNASDSSIGSTQNPVNVLRPVVVPPDQRFPSKPQRFNSDHLAGDENQTPQRNITQNTRSKSKAAIPFYQTSSNERRNTLKEGSVSLSSSTLDRNHNFSSTEKMKDKRKSVDVPLSSHNTKNTSNSKDTSIPHSAEKLKDKGKENAVQSGGSLTRDANSNVGVTVLDSLMKRKDKGKAIAVPLDYLSRKNLKYNIMEFGVPLKGVVIKERDGAVTGSSSVNPAQKDKGKGALTSTDYQTLKKDQQSSCPPILKTTSKSRNVAEGTEDVLQSKLQTEPPPTKKKRRLPVKEVKEEHTLPQDFVEQQRAYFKEIDDFELQVEEV